MTFLRHHPTPAGQASGFGTTFLWVLAITIAATVVLARTEHHARRRANASKLEETADAATDTQLTRRAAG